MLLTVLGGADIVTTEAAPQATGWGGHLSVAVSPNPILRLSAEAAGWKPFREAVFERPTISKTMDFHLRGNARERWAPTLEVQVTAVFLPLTIRAGNWDGAIGLGLGGGAIQLSVNSCDSPCEPEAPQWQPVSVLRMEFALQTGALELRFRGDSQIWISRSHGTWLEQANSMVWGLDVGWSPGSAIR